MCKKVNNKKCPNTRIDKCMVKCIYTLKSMKPHKVVACCCGHGKYNKTIIMENLDKTHWDLLTGIIVPRKCNLYKRDKQGYYYIPEVEEKWKTNGMI